MRFSFAGSLALTLVAIVPFHAQAQGDTRAAAEVATLVARYDSARNRRDTIAVGRMLAPRYQYFTSRGGVSSRDETMKFLSAPDYLLEHAKRSELSVSERAGGSGEPPLAGTRELSRRGLRGRPALRPNVAPERTRLAAVE